MGGNDRGIMRPATDWHPGLGVISEWTYISHTFMIKYRGTCAATGGDHRRLLVQCLNGGTSMFPLLLMDQIPSLRSKCSWGCGGEEGMESMPGGPDVRCVGLNRLGPEGDARACTGQSRQGARGSQVTHRIVKVSIQSTGRGERKGESFSTQIGGDRSSID